MTYETVIDEMLRHIPQLREMDAFRALEDDSSAPYIVFGNLLVPSLENALRTGDLKFILRTCAFLEETALSSQHDDKLKSLMQIEIGEWLGGTSLEEEITPWLGKETKVICRYVPGLAMQRYAIRAAKEKNHIGHRIAAAWKKMSMHGSRDAD